jgi:hypothetical protein
MSVRVGFVGYSLGDFNREEFSDYVSYVFDVLDCWRYDDIVIVSGYTDIGVPGIVYSEADDRGYEMWGVSCSKYKGFDTYDVDWNFVIGDEWGDESEFFVSLLDFIVRIGGGEQSCREIGIAREMGVPVLFNVE